MAKNKNSPAHVQKIPFLPMPWCVPFKNYRANDLNETCNPPDLETKVEHNSKLRNFLHRQLPSLISTL